jgi:hypothetical protein
VKVVASQNSSVHANFILVECVKSSIARALMNVFALLNAQKDGGMKYEGMCHLLQTGW